MEGAIARPYVALLMLGDRIHMLFQGPSLESTLRHTTEHVRVAGGYIPDPKRPGYGWIGHNSSIYLVQDNRPSTLWYRPVRKDHAYSMIKSISIEFLGELRALLKTSVPPQPVQ